MRFIPVIAVLAALCQASAPALAGCGGVSVQAHRGARPAAENTAEAVTLAGRKGYDAAEIDIQRLRDGRWVLHHDAVTGRAVTGARAPVASLDSAQWSRLRAVRADGSAQGAPSTLGEAVAAAATAGLVLHIEVKQPASCPHVRTAVAEARPLGDRVVWSTTFPEVARCLAAEGVDYLGLVIGPSAASGMVSEKMDKAGELARRFGIGKERVDAVRTTVEARYEAGANRELLAPGGLAKASQMMAGAGTAAVHLADADYSPALAKQAANMGLSIAVYGENGDASLAAALRSMPGSAAAAIVDGDVKAFCRAAGL